MERQWCLRKLDCKFDVYIGNLNKQTDRQTSKQTNKSWRKWQSSQYKQKVKGVSTSGRPHKSYLFEDRLGLIVKMKKRSGQIAFFQKTSGVPHHQHHIKGIFCRPTATFWIVKTLWTVYCKESKIKPHRESQNRPKVLWISGIWDQKTLQNLWLFQKRQICDVALPFFASAEKKTPRGWTTSGTDSAPRTVRPRPWIPALRIGYDTPW